jgi:hypothetical protein
MQLFAGLAATGVSRTFEQVLRQLREHRSEHAKVRRDRALPWCTLMGLLHLGRRPALPELRSWLRR